MCAAIWMALIPLSPFVTHSNQLKLRKKKDGLVRRILSRIVHKSISYPSNENHNYNSYTNTTHSKFQVSSTLHCNTNIYILLALAYVCIIPLYVNIEHFAENLSLFLLTFSIPVDLPIQLTLLKRWYYYCFGRQSIRKTTNIFVCVCVFDFHSFSGGNPSIFRSTFSVLI